MNALREHPTSCFMRYGGVAAVLLLTTAVTAWRFRPWMPDVFFGDDLAILLQHRDGLFASTLRQALTEASSEKFRPVFGLAMWAAFGAFAQNLHLYLAADVFLQGLSACLAFCVARRLSGGSVITALAVSLAIATSRFALYQVTQVTGLLEGLAFVLFLVTVYALIRADEDGSTARASSVWSWGAIVAALLTCHAHERYMPVVPWLCIALVCFPRVRRLGWPHLTTLLIAAIAVLGVNVGAKRFLLHVPFFVGTGGTRMRVVPAVVRAHVRQALLSVLGFNDGPPWFAGAQLSTLHDVAAWAAAIVFAMTWAGGVIAGLRSASATGTAFARSARWPALLVVLAGLLLAPPILTIRLEQRWLLQPFTLLLFVFAWAVGAWRGRAPASLAWACSFALLASSLALDEHLSRHFGNIFFVYSGRLASMVGRDIAQPQRGDARDVVLAVSEDHCTWTLQGGRFFQVYGGRARTVHCLGADDQLRTIPAPLDSRVYEVASGRLVDVTERWRDQAQTSGATRGD